MRILKYTLKMILRNPFKSLAKRAAFDACIRSYEAMAGGIRYPDGSRCLGNSAASAFWLGYDGLKGAGHYVTRADKDTMGYVYWRAGQCVAKANKAIDTL